MDRSATVKMFAALRGSMRLRRGRALLAVVGAATQLSVSTAEGVHWARINGHPLYYEVRGTGPVLLLLHGGGDSARHSFERQIDLFAAKYETIAPDQVGQGRTPDVVGPLSYTGMLDDTVALLQQLQVRRADVVGFSDGGILALMLAARHPEMVRRLVVSGVNIAPEGLEPDALEDLRAMPESRLPKNIDDKLRELWLHAPTSQELNLKLLEGIEEPVLLMSGDRDDVTLEHTLKIFHALPHAQLCILPGTDHDTFGAHAAWVNPIALAFLARRH